MQLKQKADSQINKTKIEQITEETRRGNNLKEEIYDRIHIPIWVLDILIAVLTAAFFAILHYGR